MGNHSYTVSNARTPPPRGGDTSRSVSTCRLPHIVLDPPRATASVLGLWERGQHLSLEGDFDRYFRLYCPTGYERDALYLFTPDVMARFIDSAATLEVEIVDDWLFLYSSTELSTLDRPARWAWCSRWGRPCSTSWSSGAGGATTGCRMRPPPTGDRRGPRHRRPGRAATASAAVPCSDAAVPVGIRNPPPGVAAPGRRLRRGGVWVITAIVAGTVVLALDSRALVFVPILLMMAR